MRRLAVVVSAVASLMLMSANAALADHSSAANNAPGCNGTIFLTDSPSGGDLGTDPQYTQGQTVYVFGDMFDADDLVFSYQVIVEPPSPQQGTVVASGSLSGDGSGHIAPTAVYDTSNATTDGPYKVLVSWSAQGDNPDPCTKSKNFKINLEEGGGGGGGTTTGGGTTGGTTGGGGAGAGGGGGGGGGGGLGEEAGGTVVAGELPFTGLPVWIVLLIGLSLIGGGLAVLRRTRLDH